MPGDPNPKNRGALPRRSVFVCPAYIRVPAYFMNGSHPWGSYGFNWAGTGFQDSNPCLGLGGGVVRAPWQVPEDIVPTPESAIRNPSDLFAIGDAVLLPYGGFTTNGLGGYADLSETGLLNPAIRRELGLSTWAYGANSASANFFETTRTAMKRRHRDRFNIVFADAHSENLRMREVFYPSDTVLRRWNNDNLPHREFHPEFR